MVVLDGVLVGPLTKKPASELRSGDRFLLDGLELEALSDPQVLESGGIRIRARWRGAPSGISWQYLESDYTIMVLP